MNHLSCPVCSEEIVVTKHKRYESLCEHVSDPNGLPSIKPGYTCLNVSCIANQMDATWTEDGALYMVGTRDEYDTIKSLSSSGTYYAKRSWEEGYEKMIMKQKKFTIKFNFWFYLLVIEPQYRQTSIEQFNYTWELRKIKFSWYKRNSDGSYIGVFTFWNLLFFTNRTVTDNFNAAMAGNKYSLNQLNQILTDTSGWGSKETRTRQLWVNKIIRFVHSGKFFAISKLKM